MTHYFTLGYMYMLDLNDSLKAVFFKKATEANRTIGSLVDEIEKYQSQLSLESESLTLLSALDKIEHPTDIRFLREIEDKELRESLSLESPEKIYVLKEKIVSSIGRFEMGENIALEFNTIERQIAKTAYDLGNQIKNLMKKPLPEAITLTRSRIKPIFLFDGLSYSKENLVKTENILGNSNEFSVLTSWILQHYALGNGVDNFGNRLNKFFLEFIKTIGAKVSNKGTSESPEDVEEMEQFVKSFMSEVASIDASSMSLNPFTKLIMDGSGKTKFTYKGKFSSIETDRTLRSQSQINRFNERSLIAFMGPALGKALARSSAKSEIVDYFDKRDALPSRHLKVTRNSMTTGGLLNSLPKLEFDINLEKNEIEVLDNMLKDTIHRVNSLFNLLSDIKNIAIPFLGDAYKRNTKNVMLIYTIYAAIMDSTVGVILKELCFQLHLTSNLIGSLYSEF